MATWTRKAGLFLFFSIISLIFGLILPDFQMIILALLLFTFFLLVLIIPRPMITVKKKISDNTMFEDGDLEVNLQLTKTESGYGSIEVYDRIPVYSELTNGYNCMIFNPEVEQRLDYNAKFPLRGYYSIGPTRVRITDHFNLFYEDQILIEKEPITVFPEVTGIKDFKFKSKKNIHFPGDFLTTQAGSSNEFYHIRDYIKGDPFKKINWKVYARKRELMINEYEKENICDSFLFIDARAISNIGTLKENTLEYGIKLSLGLAHYLILRRNQVGVVVYNDRIQMVPPKPGMRQFNEILSFLTGVYPRGWLDLNTAINYATPYLKSKTTIIIFSILDYDQSFLNATQLLAAQDFKIILITPSAVEFELNAVNYDGPMEKVNLTKLSKQCYLSELRGLGVKVIEYRPEENIGDVLDDISQNILR